MKSPTRYFLLVLALILAVVGVGCDGATGEGKCTPEFPYREGWLGSDGVVSVPLSSGRNLWLFGESFIALSGGQTTRDDTARIGNSIAVSNCDADSGEWSISYNWQGKGTANPRAFFLPPSGNLQFRAMDGFTHNGAIYVLLHKGRVESPGDPFGFTRVGVTLAKINGDPASASASVELQDLPVAGDVYPGIAAVAHNGYAYLYASIPGRVAGSVTATVLTRIALSGLASANSNVEYYAADGTWKRGLNPNDLMPMFAPGASKLSVRFHDGMGQWVAVYNEPRAFSRKVLMRTASNLEGPWSEAQVVFQFPEMDPTIPGFDQQTFCHSATENLELSDGDSTALTYSCNSVDATKVATNMSLYQPKLGAYTSPIQIPGGAHPVIGASSEGIEKPTPERGFMMNMGTSLSVSLARNETTGRVLEVSVTDCQPITLQNVPAGVNVTLFHMPEMRTERPSFRGGISGTHYDPLVPFATTTSQVCPHERFIWADIGVERTVAPGNYSFSIGGLPVSLRVWKFTIPELQSWPFYVGVGSFSLVKGHNLPLDSGIDVVAPLTQAYVNLFREHRLEPQGPAIQSPPVNEDGTLNLDNWSSFGASFRQIVLNGALSPVCVESPAKVGLPWVPTETLRGWERALQTEPSLANAWIYITDEPFLWELPGVAERARFVREHAPSLKIMVTTEPTEELVGLVDHFAVVMEHFNQPGHWQQYERAPEYFLYASCVSHGSCANDEIGNLTGAPDMVFDQPSVHGRAYALVSYMLGAKATIYYNSTEAYGQLDPWVSQYLFAGNGDGTVVYPGRAGELGFQVHQPVASIRMKAFRQGQYDVEYLIMARNAGISTNIGTLVQDQFNWSRRNTDYEALRETIGNALHNR